MICSPSIIKISTALLQAQKEIGGAKKGSTNPFYKMKYSGLGSVMEACKDAFNNHGISVIQPICLEADTNVLKTILLHESGEFIESSMKVSCKNPDNPQEMGSAITYAKRYALMALAFIPSEDDDGEMATKPSRPVTEPIKTTSNQVYTPNVTTKICADCKKSVDEKVAAFSNSKFGKVICFVCQKKQNINKVQVETVEINTDDFSQ